jgi:magnesium-transporting ATPase (P-type)
MHVQVLLTLDCCMLPMCAGDHALTALAIGGMLGIAGNGQVFTGPEIDRIDDGALRAIVLSCNVYARASPENKLRIVRALQVRAAARCYIPCGF